MRWAGTRSRYGGDEKLVQNLSRITFREEIAYDNDDVIEIAYETIERIKLAQDWDQWRILVNKIMNFRVP